MEAPPVERHLAAILAADVEGYSSLMHGDEEATMATLSARRVSTSSLGSIEGGLRTPPAIASLPNS
jgi:adenylate cyclase